MKKLLFLAMIVLFAGCSSKDTDVSPETTNSLNLGYFKGMSKLDCEYQTGQHIESKLLEPSLFHIANMYTLPDYDYNIRVINGETHRDGFYPQVLFKFYGERLVSIELTFRFYSGTIRGNESQMLYPSEKDAILEKVKEYISSLNIDATYSFQPFDEDDYYNTATDAYVIILGVVNLK